MRKFTNLFIALITGTGIAMAGNVTQQTAQKVAANFYGQTYGTTVNTITLAYTEKDASGLEVYYAFNINGKGGFVIVSAEDAGKPIIGYSNKGQYVVPAATTNFDFWMQKRKTEIVSMRAQKLIATTDITNEWTAYKNNTPYQAKDKPKKATGLFPSSSSYLVQSTWDQPSPYNNDCPGGSVTGCVATAMSQIMRYWSYPPVGTGSSSYNEGTYGVLSANYAHPYRWANMPLTSPSSSDTDMERLLSDAGISVEMNYSPSGSGAYVITSDDPSACAQISYVKYFGYSPSLIDGQNVFSNMTTWQDTLENELNCSRPIQYIGSDPSAGGHTWVCDGYDASNNFHMNWGWSAADDGWFTLSNLNPGSYDFSTGMEALYGIIPPTGIVPAFTATPSTGCVGVTITFTDQSYGQGTPTAWKWKFGDGGSSTLQNPTHKYTTAGTYNVMEIVTDNTGKKDTLSKMAYITIQPSTGKALPLSEGFQESYFTPTGWVINNPNGHSTTWAQSTAVGGFGKSTQCMYYNNCAGGITGNYDQIYTASYNFSADAKPLMHFDVAYAPEDAAVGTDTLAVYYSTDCGATWKNAYLKGGLQLSTYGGAGYFNVTDYKDSGCWVPSSSQWRTDTIQLPVIAGMPAVMFSFENRSGNGNSMFIDNINIPGSPLATPTLTNTSKVSVYPNPNNGSFTVDINNAQDKQQLEIYNMLGQNIYGTVVMEGKTQVNFTQTPGVYFYRILTFDGKMVSEGKVIVK